MILKIDTSDQKKITVELLENGKVIKCLSGENEHGSEILLPLIKKILEKNQLDFKDLTGIEVKEGPGSFTGLRVGASVAQALGYSLNIPVNGKLKGTVKLKYT